jgi:hypothetical protein
MQLLAKGYMLIRDTKELHILIYICPSSAKEEDMIHHCIYPF